MSTTIDKGLQVRTYSYREEARARFFNKVVDRLLPAGIYDGGALRVNGNVQVALDPVVCLIKPGNIGDNNDLDISIRVETTAFQPISLASIADPSQPETLKPYIVLRFDWVDQESNYMDMLPVAFSDDPEEIRDDFLQPSDLIVGKVLFEDDGIGGLRIVQDENVAFDYTRRANAFVPDSSAAFTELRVQSSENNPNSKVYVTKGSINTSLGRQDITGGDYPTATDISNTSSLGRIDIVFVDENGSILVKEGIPAITPVAPDYENKKVIGEITRGPNRTDILGTDIRQVNVTRQGTITASNFPIIDAGSYFVGNKYIESAFQQVGEELYDNIYGADNPDWIKDIHIDWGIGADQVSAVDMPIEDALGIISAGDVEGAFAEIKALLDTHIATEIDGNIVHGIELIEEIL